MDFYCVGIVIYTTECCVACVVVFKRVCKEEENLKRLISASQQSVKFFRSKRLEDPTDLVMFHILIVNVHQGLKIA